MRLIIREVVRVRCDRGSFFDDVKEFVYTDKALKDAVAIETLYRVAGIRVFGEEKFSDYYEDLAYSYEDPFSAWPDNLLIPKYPPKDKRAREIYRLAREHVKEYARLIKEYLKHGYVPVLAVYDKSLDKKTAYKYKDPHHTWTYGVQNRGKVIILAKFE